MATSGGVVTVVGGALSDSQLRAIPAAIDGIGRWVGSDPSCLRTALR